MTARPTYRMAPVAWNGAGAADASLPGVDEDVARHSRAPVCLVRAARQP